MKNKIWLNIYQIQKIESMIKEKNDKIIEIDLENELDRKEELEKITNEILGEFKELNFDKIPSVETDKIKTYIEESDVIKKIETYKTISLLEHINNILYFIKENQPQYNPNEYEYLYFFALLHDAGKSKTLRIKYSITKENHEQASGIYGKLKLQNTCFEHIGEAIYIYSNKRKDNYFLKKIYDTFHLIDKEIRILELKNKEKNNYI